MNEYEIAEIKKRDQLVLNSKTFKYIAEKYSFSQKRVLDIGCGYGEYMQRCRTDSVGITTNPHEVEYGPVSKRDIRLGNVETLSNVIGHEERFDVFWCNNIFEHLLSPHAFLVNLKQFAGPDSLLILGTPMVPSIKYLMMLKRFRGALATPHVNFFTRTTYRLTAEYAGWSVHELSPYFFHQSLLDSLLAPIAPHLYLVATNNDAYRYPPKKLKEWALDSMYQTLIKIMNKE